MIKVIRALLGVSLLSVVSLVSAVENDAVLNNPDAFSDYKEAVSYLSTIMGEKESFVPKGYMNIDEMEGKPDFQYTNMPSGKEYDFPGTFKYLNQPVSASDANLRTLYYYLNPTKDFRVVLNYSQGKVYNAELLVRLFPIQVGKKIDPDYFDRDLAAYLTANGWSKDLGFFNGYAHTFSKNDVIIKFNKRETTTNRYIYSVAISSDHLSSEFVSVYKKREKEYYDKAMPLVEKLHSDAFQLSVRLK